MNRLWFVYMLLCDQKTFYIGITTDIVKRINQHLGKESFFTKKFSEIEMVYCEQFESEHAAAMREKQLKGWNRAKKQMLIVGKLGVNTCTEHAKDLLAIESHVSS